MKKLAISQIIYLGLILIFIESCSSAPEIRPEQNTYSPSTQKAFETIEKTDLHPTQTISQKNRPAPRISSVSKSSLREKPKEVLKETSVAPILSNDTTDIRKLSAKNQERLQEINQNLIFFCMKHRKDPAFQNEERCMAFTKKILARCEKKHKLINTVMVNCIKDRLKKRR